MPDVVVDLVHAIASRMPHDVGRVLRLHVDAARVTAETPGRSMDLAVAPDTPRVPLPNGPVAPIPAVVDESGQMAGEVLLWVADGHLIGVERPWVTDDPPTTWPRVDELDFVRKPSPHPAEVTTIREIVEGPWHREWGSKPEMDPLTEPDALMEAQIIDIWVDAMRSRIAVLLEMRMALQLREGNTGLLVAYHTTDVHWHIDEHRDLSRTAWNVVGSEPAADNGELTLRLGCIPDAVLSLRARSAAYYSLEVLGLDEVPPNYGDPPVYTWPEDGDPPPEFTDAQLNQRLARWDSEVVPIHAVFLDELDLDEIDPDEPDPTSPPPQPAADPNIPAPGWWTRRRWKRS